MLFKVLLTIFSGIGSIWLCCTINTTVGRTKKGEEQYSILFPKYKKGGYIVRRVMENSSYGKY